MHIAKISQILKSYHFNVIKLTIFFPRKRKLAENSKIALWRTVRKVRAMHGRKSNELGSQCGG